MNQHLFDTIAMQYLREDLHWGADIDVLKLAFEEALQVFDGRMNYMDVGCGPGFHLCAIKEMYPEVPALGIDPSPHMLKKARERVGRLSLPFVSFEETEILDIGNRMFGVISCFNTLGNLRECGVSPEDTRREIMRHASRLLMPGGSLVVSVYDLAKLTEPYGRNIQILPESDRGSGDLLIEYSAPNGETAKYYSHWFTQAELLCLFEKNGFKVDFLEQRMFRLVVKAYRA